MPKKLQTKKAKRFRPDERDWSSVVLSMKCRPKKDTKHLYSKCEDGSGLVDLGVIVCTTFSSCGESDCKGDCSVPVVTVVDKGRIWDVTVYDPKAVVAKYPPRKK
jgi:hypothetical protein